MDGAQFGVSGSLRVCVKCKSFEKSIPQPKAGAVPGTTGPSGHRPSPPPFVPLFHPPESTEDGTSQFELEAYGTDFIRTCVRVRVCILQRLLPL